MSQHAIASSLGISRSSYCAIEAGRQPLGLYHAIKLSEISRVDFRRLWSDDLQKVIIADLHEPHPLSLKTRGATRTDRAAFPASG